MAETLDLSRLPAPTLITVDYEAIRSARLVDLKARLLAAGIDWDVESLETDSGVILQEADAYREALALAAINDAFRAGLVAFASGAALDHIGATLHFMARMTDESDARYRQRLQFEADNKAGGRLSGYVREAMSVSLDVYAVGAWVDRSVQYEPAVRLALQIADGDGAPASDLVNAVQLHMDREDGRQATDVVVVQPVAVTAYSVSVKLFHRPGPDPVTLRASARAAVLQMIGERWTPGRDVPLSAVIAAASVAGVERVEVVSPMSDLVMGPGQLATCTEVTITSEVSSE